MSTTIAPVATIALPNPARILKASWCPDKDLLVVLSSFAHQQKLALWKMSGSKKWEIDLPGNSDTKVEEIVDIAWSPDVQSIAVVSNPGAITIHSIQNGAVEQTIAVSVPDRRFRVTGAWWFREEKKPTGTPLPEVFKRGENITGSAHAILRNLPLLDPIQDESKPLSSNELFAFHGARNRAAQAPIMPPIITTWPSLPSDLAAASIASNKPDAQQSFPEAEDEADDTNVNSILAVSDNLGNVHLFLEGSYPLGRVRTGDEVSPRSLYKLREYLFVHPGPASDASSPAVPLRPIVLRLSYLTGRHYRDVARVSTSSRELLSYAMRVVRDMRIAWFGSDSNSGARDLGPKWVRALEERQRNEFGHEDPLPILDLTCLLTTGRTSEALTDYMGSGEHMSERSIQRWEVTMTEALTSLRDLAEKRVAPACQRLRLLLQEVQGWASLPQYEVCNLRNRDIEGCLDMTGRAIILCAWLAAGARKELVRFKEFMKWVRFEIARTTAPDHQQPRPTHDILEVNDYLTSGLVVSQIDKWFVGPAPRFTAESLGVPQSTNISFALRKARAALNRWDQTVHEEVKRRDLSHHERNLDALLQILAEACQSIFNDASEAAARSAVLVAGSVGAARSPEEPRTPRSASAAAPLIRERTVQSGSEADKFLQYLAIRPPHDGGRSYLCVARMQQGLNLSSEMPAVEVAALKCCAAVAGSDVEEAEPFAILDVEFFDDEQLVMVYRPRNAGAATCVATVGYANLMYHPIPGRGYVTGTTRETLMEDVLAALASGQVRARIVALFSVGWGRGQRGRRRYADPACPVFVLPGIFSQSNRRWPHPTPVWTQLPSAGTTPIRQSRALRGCREGAVTLAVNGRAGRRVSCVLDGTGTTVEVLDMEGEDEELEEEEEAGEGAAEGSG